MTNVKRYDIDYNKVEVERIPNDLRSNEVIAWLAVLCMPFVFIYNQFIAYRTAKLYELSITPQVCYLEKMLNDRYDTELRRINIIDGESRDPEYDYLKEELNKQYLYTKAEILDNPSLKQYDYLKGELGALSFDFIVLVPADLTFNKNEMIGLLDNNALPTMLFSIQTF